MKNLKKVLLIALAVFSLSNSYGQAIDVWDTSKNKLITVSGYNDCMKYCEDVESGIEKLPDGWKNVKCEDKDGTLQVTLAYIGDSFINNLNVAKSNRIRVKPSMVKKGNTFKKRNSKINAEKIAARKPINYRNRSQKQ